MFAQPWVVARMQVKLRKRRFHARDAALGLSLHGLCQSVRLV
jgi:hypothetical protein